jgi:hypothetical protein
MKSCLRLGYVDFVFEGEDLGGELVGGGEEGLGLQAM